MNDFYNPYIVKFVRHVLKMWPTKVRPFEVATCCKRLHSGRWTQSFPPPYKYPLNFEPFRNHTLVSFQQVNLILSWKSSSLALLPTVPVSFCWVVHVAWCIVGIWPADPIDLKQAGPDGKIPPVPRANQIAEFSELLCSRVVDGKVMLEQRGIRFSSGVQLLQTNLG